MSTHLDDLYNKGHRSIIKTLSTLSKDQNSKLEKMAEKMKGEDGEVVQ